MTDTLYSHDSQAAQRETRRYQDSQVTVTQTMVDIAREKVCQDMDRFSEFICAAGMGPSEVEPSEYFKPVSTARLLREVLMSQIATDEQLAEGWKELRRRLPHRCRVLRRATAISV